jgi:probable phosphoglycerate mutase
LETWHKSAPFEDPVFERVFADLRRNSDEFLAARGYRRNGGVYEITAGNRERIAVFCHAGFGLTWLAHLLDLPVPLVWSGFFLAPSSVTTVLFEERSSSFAAPRCLSVGDTSHLHAAGLPTQPAGIVANFD